MINNQRINYHTSSSAIIYAVGSAVVVRLINYINITLLIKSQTTEDMAAYFSAQAVIALSTALGSFGLGVASTKILIDTSRYSPPHNQTIIKIAYALSAGCSTLITFAYILFVLCAPEALSIQESWIKIFLILSPLIILESISTVQQGLAFGLMLHNRVARKLMLQALVTSILLLHFTTIPDIANYCYAYVALRVLAVCDMHSLVNDTSDLHKVRTTSREIFAYARKLLSIGIPSALGSLTQSPITVICNQYVTSMPNGAKGLVEYNVALQLRVIQLFIPDAVSKLIFSHFTMNALNNKGLGFAVIALCSAMLFLTATSGFLLYYLADTINRVLFDEKYNLIPNMLAYVFLGGLLISASNIVGHALIALGRNWWDCIIRTVSGVITVLSMYFISQSSAPAERYAESALMGTAFLLVIQTFALCYFETRSTSKGSQC